VPQVPRREADNLKNDALSIEGTMTNAGMWVWSLLALASWPGAEGDERAAGGPETVVVRSGDVTLHALVWRPPGPGPFPAVLVNHGSGRTREELERLGPYEGQAEILGPVFGRHGYVLLFLFRRGVGPSSQQGPNSIDLLTREAAAHGLEARNTLQLRLLEGREMGDATAGLAFLRTLPGVEAHNVALVGHSFGGSLSLLLAEREPDLRAVVVFSCAGYSWDLSPPCDPGCSPRWPTRPRRSSSSTPRTTTRSRPARRSMLGDKSWANRIG
jgi:dienelactone hydrolase